MDNTFCGWYFRCQSKDRTVALIPAAHTVKGDRTGSLQIITEAGSLLVPFSREDVSVSPEHPRAVLGKSVFRENGIWLNAHTAQVSVSGELRFGPLSPIRYDIMGPFRYVPFMECRHSVASMRHTVNGNLCVNGTSYHFANAAGYLEGDRGRSFPRRYAWTQCFFEGGSLMLSIAEIPLGALRFQGIIGIVCVDGLEYRFATYLGAKAEKLSDGQIVVRQGRTVLSAALLEKRAHSLKAPACGAMSRNIRENVACRAAYRFSIGNRKILDLESSRAAFEYEYPDSGESL